MCCPDCVTYPRDEYQHGRRALKALQRLLGRLESLPGRKVILFFNQNGMLYPGRFYPVDDTRIGDHLRMVDEVAAEATTSRAVIYAAYSGDLSSRRIPQYPGFDAPPAFADEIGDFAVNLGANLADFTGGGYNRAVSALPEMLREAGRGCACIYRLAIEPPKGDRRRIYSAKVEVAGERLPYLYRVQHLTGMDRWWRRATVAPGHRRAAQPGARDRSAAVRLGGSHRRHPKGLDRPGPGPDRRRLSADASRRGHPARAVGGGSFAPAGRRPQPARDARHLRLDT
jgi:hypothetical protein